MTDKIVRVRCDACGLLMPVGATYTDDDGFIACLPSFPVSNRPEDSNRFLRGRCDQNEAPSNPLNLETSDLDPITPEEDALATAIIAAMGRTRQSHDTAVRAIRAGMAAAGAHGMRLAMRTLTARSAAVSSGRAMPPAIRSL